MKVILLEDIKGIGKKDQMIDASDGHAKNYLIPRKLAVEATKDNITMLEKKRHSAEMKRKQEVEAATALKNELENKVIKMEVKKGENGKLFGSVTNREVAQVLQEQTGIEIDKKKIILSEPIKSVGIKHADVKLYQDIAAKLTIEIL